GAGAAAGAALAPLAEGPAWATVAPRWPSRRLGSGAARRVDPREFLPVSQLRAWQRELDGLGLRATGTKAQDTYIDALRERLARAAVAQLHFERVAIRRWTAQRWSLTLAGGLATGAVRTAAYIPYSGHTPARGVTGQLTVIDSRGPL